MEVSEVRLRILDDHETIRTLLAQLAELTERVQAGDDGAAGRLVDCGRHFLEFFLEHIALENRILVPALRKVDAWGEVRAERVREEHEQQADAARVLLDQLVSDPARTEAITARLEAFAQELETDMAHEERASLSEDLLRDDVVGIDVEAG